MENKIETTIPTNHDTVEAPNESRIVPNRAENTPIIAREEAAMNDRSAYNCPVCGGEGLVDNNTARCPQCGGTGKI